MISEAGAVLVIGGLEHIFPREDQAIWCAVRCYYGRLLLPQSQKVTGSGGGTRLCGNYDG